MSVRISTERLRARRIIKNVVNRLQASQIYEQSDEYQNMLKIANRYGVNIWTNTDTKTLDSIYYEIEEDFNINNALLQLDRIYTKPQLETILARKKGIKRTTQQPRLTEEDVEQIQEDIKLRSEYKQFIENNIQAIYKYENINGNVISGKKTSRPEWSDLTTMRASIETNPELYNVREHKENIVRKTQQKLKQNNFPDS